MLAHVHRFVLPAAYSVLPPPLASTRATAMLLAIGLQESKFTERIQLPHGPARGFWQFERGGGVRGVMSHKTSKPLLLAALRELRFDYAIGLELSCHRLVECNDTVAAVFARLLLATLPERLPALHEPNTAWQQYLDAWRPGKPHPETWRENYERAWVLASLGETK